MSLSIRQVSITHRSPTGIYLHICSSAYFCSDVWLSLQPHYIAVGFEDKVALSLAPGTCPAPWNEDVFMDHTMWKENYAPQGLSPSWCKPANTGPVLIYTVWGYVPCPSNESFLLSVPDHKLNIRSLGFFVCVLLCFALFCFVFHVYSRKAATNLAQQ